MAAALYQPSSAGRIACCELLLEHGADIHNSGDAALCLAAKFGHLETVAFLLDRGTDAWSERAMQLATAHHYGLVVALLPARTLHYAAHAGGLMDVRFLLAVGVDAGARRLWLGADPSLPSRPCPSRRSAA
jgi:hypothetical protein